MRCSKVIHHITSLVLQLCIQTKRAWRKGLWVPLYCDSFTCTASAAAASNNMVDLLSFETGNAFGFT
jgi:hypothetical protein